MADPYQNNLSTLAARIWPFMANKVQGSPGVGAGVWGKIIVMHRSGALPEWFDVTAAGLTSALAAASANDVIWIPTCDITLEFTVPEQVGIASMGHQSTIHGTVTPSHGSHLEDIDIVLVGSSAGALSGIIGPSTGLAYLLRTSCQVTNNGAGGAYAIQGGEGQIEMYVGDYYATANGGGTARAVYGTVGDIYSRWCNFHAEESGVEVNPISGGSGTYTKGATIATGAIPILSPAGVIVSGLSIGSWYCIEATGGPWIPMGGHPGDYRYQISDDDGADWGSIVGIGMGNDGIVRTAVPAWVSGYETVGTYYVRCYFQATTDHIKIRLDDSYFADNSGSLGYELSAAAAAGGVVHVLADDIPLLGLTTPVPRWSDRSAWDDIAYGPRHARDINAGIGLHHLPPGTNIGDTLYWNGSAWAVQPAGTVESPLADDDVETLLDDSSIVLIEG